MEINLETKNSTETCNEGTLYSFYTSDGIKSGLSYINTQFILNNKPLQILSGSLHYFRFFPQQWEESIKKMRYCHLNTVCTYVPWNLHEDQPGVFDFTSNLDLKLFIETVKQQEMFLILRVGPYICAEIDFGGLPSWLLRDKNMKVRSNYIAFLEAVRHYFTELVTLIYDYQFSVNGGPIIAVQVENEFGSYGNTQTNKNDYEYMVFLKNLLVELGIKELLFTCDMPSLGLQKGSIPDVLMTANFQTDAVKELDILKELQPNKPILVAELWCGWFDHWGEKHEEVSVDIYKETLEIILQYNASFNIYVFHGGTNFGFSNGANIGFPLPESPYCSTVTSYDYGALLTENGTCSEKYYTTVSLLRKVKKEYSKSNLNLMDNVLFLSIDNLPVLKYLPLNKVLSLVKKYECSNPLIMEELGSNCGQRFGFVIYETKFNESGNLAFHITRGIRIVIFVNFVVVSVIEHAFSLQNVNIKNSLKNKESVLWLLVENLGRINFTEKPEILNSERRGLFGSVYLNNVALENWNIYSLDFSTKFMHEISLLKGGDFYACNDKMCVGLYLALLNLDRVEDSFIYSPTWTKGVVVVNNFNIGRYWKIGPQQTLFVSRYALKKGLNKIIAFELQSKIKSFEFKNFHILDRIEET